LAGLDKDDDDDGVEGTSILVMRGSRHSMHLSSRLAHSMQT
jgi:hypothetical protein